MSGPSDLSEEQERHLVQVARDARLRAHAPYSHFAVGAALMDEQGRVHAGANIENAAYPQGLCAEAAALAALPTFPHWAIPSAPAKCAMVAKCWVPCAESLLCRNKVTK